MIINSDDSRNENVHEVRLSNDQYQRYKSDLLPMQRSLTLQYNNGKTLPFSKCLKYIVCLFFLCFIVFCFSRYQRIDQDSSTRKLAQETKSGVANKEVQRKRKGIIKMKLKQILFPKIIWIQSEYPLEAQSIITSVFANNWLNVANKSHMQVRVVNNFNAFEYLSPEMVHRVIQIKQKSRDYIDMSEILRLALLIEHGGLSLKVGNVMLREEFSQIHQRTKQVMVQFIQKKKYVPDIILFHNFVDEKLRINDEVIYCHKQSKILIQILNDLSKILANGEWPYRYLNGAKNEDQQEKISQYRDVIHQIINAKIKDNFTTIEQFSKKFNVLSLNDTNNPIALRLPDSQFYDDSRIDRQQFVFKYCNLPIHISNMNTFKLMLIEQNLNNNMNSWSSSSSVFSYQILNIQSNRWIVEPIEQFADVEFCIISLKTQDSSTFQNQIKQSIQKLNKQTFKKWKSVYFVQNLNKTPINYTIQNAQVIVVNASQYQGLNFQRAATKYCNGNSIAVFINYDEFLQKQNSLQTLLSFFLNRNTFGSFISTVTNSIIYNPRAIDASNLKNVPPQLLEEHYNLIRNNFRAVRIQNYRYLSHFTLHSFDGKYYDIQIPLMALLQLSSNFQSCKKTQAYYHIKRVSKKISFPINIKLVHTVQVISPRRIQISISKKSQYNMINFHNQLCKGITQFSNLKRHPLESIFVLNDGSEFQSPSIRSTTKYSIPKIMHTILLNENETSYKRQIIKNNKLMNPQYKYVVWSQNNINLQNFPSAYNIIVKLMQFKTILFRQPGGDKNNISYTSYIYAESIKNLMKKQILYRFGGFYVDQNYMFFRKNSLNQFTSYKAMIIGNRQPNTRFERYSGVIGSIKGFQNILRVNSKQRLTTFDPFSSEMNSQQDNFIYGQLIQGKQQYDSDIAQPPLHLFYPFTEEIDNKCVADPATQLSKLIFFNKKKYLKNCGQIYNESLGIYFFGQS